MTLRTGLATDNDDRREIHHCLRTGETRLTTRKALRFLTCPNDRRSLISCIISLRLRAYSVDERSSVSQLSSGEEGLPVAPVATEVAEVVLGGLAGLSLLRLKLRFIGTNERGKKW
jgi:hypothetical protein